MLADPQGSVLADYVHTGQLGQAGSWVVEGIGEDFIPDVCDLSRVKTAYTVTDTEALTAVRELLRKEGVLAGSSTGVLLAAALRYCREQKTPKRVVTLVCDSGNKYLSKQFDDNWMTDQGFLPRPRFGDLRDLVTRRHEDGAVVTLDPTDTLLTALNRMKVYGVSQLPVLEGGMVVGMVDESDLLLSGARSPARLRDPVRGVMSTRLKTVGAQTTPEELVPLFDAGFVPIVMDETRLRGPHHPHRRAVGAAPAAR